MTRDANAADCVLFSTRIPRGLHRDMKAYCVAAGTTIARFAVDALGNWLSAGRGTRRRRSAATPPTARR
jgi:hypothetical protein